MFPQVRVGPQILSDGVLTQERCSKDGAMVGANGHCSYQEMVYRGNVFSLVLPLTTGTVAAGNVVAGAAAASTQFAVANPVASGKNLVLLRFRLGVVSATTIAAGPLFHGYQSAVPTLATSGTILNNLMGSGGSSVARGYTSAGGAALTGGGISNAFLLANFATTVTTPASPYLITTDDLLDGSMIIPPGYAYVPLWQAAGTAILYGCSLTWEEIPI
jgi:hypothetical protein